VLWFTVQNGNFIGKLDPSIGAVALKPALTPKAMPHGIVGDRDGRPIFAMAGTNKIGVVDPKTMDIQELALPEGARPRRLAVTSAAAFGTETVQGVSLRASTFERGR
jgi:virginiamycin B lyase